MSSVNYSLKHKGVRLISSDEAWVKGKNGNPKFNPKYKILGKYRATSPNFILSASDKKKTKYKGDVCELNRVAKGQIVDFFLNPDGTRNRKYVAYLAIPKEKKS